MNKTKKNTGKAKISRQRREIIKFLKEYGYIWSEISWERPYYLGDKGGYAGGWFIQADKHTFMGYHYKDVCEMIRNHTIYGIDLNDKDLLATRGYN